MSIKFLLNFILKFLSQEMWHLYTNILHDIIRFVLMSEDRLIRIPILPSSEYGYVKKDSD